jgi:uncharacterized membrane protein
MFHHKQSAGILLALARCNLVRPNVWRDSLVAKCDNNAVPMSSAATPGSRLSSVDALRGLIMIIMALDHTRDFFNISAISFSPTDLSRTTVPLFFTRWITHYCMPVFMFTAGLGMAFFRQRNHTRGQLSRFLWTRGLWLIVLELTVMQFSYNFSFSSRYVLFLLVLWIFGICMIAMAALVYLPVRWLAVLSVAVIALHNRLDRIQADRFGRCAWIWNLLHEPGILSIAGRSARSPYTLIPWVAVMASGFCFGGVFLLDPAARRRIMTRLGLALTIAFIVVRSVNLYGDPFPWSHQKSAAFTVLSFLNCTKYPASLDFLLMTMGPALILLAYFDRRTFTASNPLIVFGRVPLFYFILHFYLVHVLVVILEWIRYGTAASLVMFGPSPSMGGAQAAANFRHGLGAVYILWIVVVVLLYPVCRWFAKVKSRHQNWWLSYL